MNKCKFVYFFYMYHIISYFFYYIYIHTHALTRARAYTHTHTQIYLFIYQYIYSYSIFIHFSWKLYMYFLKMISVFLSCISSRSLIVYWTRNSHHFPKRQRYVYLLLLVNHRQSIAWLSIKSVDLLTLTYTSF